VAPPFGRLQSKFELNKDRAVDAPRTMIAEGDDLRSQWARMKEFGEEVNATGYEYHPTSQNSNSFAAEALRRGSFFGPGTAFPEIPDDRLLAVDPVSGETRRLRVPAFGGRLKNPINVFEHRFGRWPRAADAGARDPGRPASDNNDTFNGPSTNEADTISNPTDWCIAGSGIWGGNDRRDTSGRSCLRARSSYDA
jgi:hypothetical protein